MSDLVRCPGCDLTIHRDFKFCPACGAGQPERTEPILADGGPFAVAAPGLDRVEAEARIDTTAIYVASIVLGVILIAFGGMSISDVFTGNPAPETIILGSIGACGGLGMICVATPSLIAFKSASAVARRQAGLGSSAASASPSVAASLGTTVAGGLVGMIAGVAVGFLLMAAALVFSIVTCCERMGGQQ